jgi:hypothetical protein
MTAATHGPRLERRGSLGLELFGLGVASMLSMATGFRAIVLLTLMLYLMALLVARRHRAIHIGA